MDNYRICTVAGCGNKIRAKRLCGGHYSRNKYHGRPDAGRAMKGDALRFVEQVVSMDTDDCIEWPYSTTSSGYGRVVVGGETIPATRAVLQASGSKMPEGKPLVLHSPGVCHNRLCVNPKHLRWGDVRDNALDRSIDGTNLVGEDNPKAKITNAQAASIKAAPGLQKDIAKRYGVAPSLVSGIKRGAFWAHLD